MGPERTGSGLGLLGPPGNVLSWTSWAERAGGAASLRAGASTMPGPTRRLPDQGPITQSPVGVGLLSGLLPCVLLEASFL